MAGVGADVVGVDWRIPIDEARRRVGPGVAIQGNLDPAVCFARWEVVENQVRQILASAEGKAGHIFNLGHGVLPPTNPEILERVVDLVHREGRSE
jgi:uroporphyrinogen decarboxylase